MEESAAIYFSSNIRHNNVTKDIPKKVLATFVALLRLILILGIVVCVFGIPYSRIVVQIYGGSFLTDNGGKAFQNLRLLA
jgi:oligosaccharide translocation protein RFT1